MMADYSQRTTTRSTKIFLGISRMLFKCKAILLEVMHIRPLSHVSLDLTTTPQHSTNCTSWRSDVPSSWLWRHTVHPCLPRQRDRGWLNRSPHDDTEESARHTHDPQHGSGATYDHDPLVTRWATTQEPIRKVHDSYHKTQVLLHPGSSGPTGGEGVQSSLDTWDISRSKGRWREVSAEMDAVGTAVKESQVHGTKAAKKVRRKLFKMLRSRTKKQEERER